MSDSFFSKLFSYRKREYHSPLENFLTEIFAYCLQTDSVFRNRFLRTYLKIKATQNCLITTQNEYEEYGRPDIEIELSNCSILIENKVDSSEAFNQLNRYSLILDHFKGEKKRRIIVFITKIFEKKELKTKTIELIQIRWHEIHNLINSKNTEATNLLKQFLTDCGMSKTLNFNAKDFLALKEIPNSIEKMDELLNRFEPDFQNYFGTISTRASRSSRLSTSSYINFVELYFKDLTYWLDIGFNWYDCEPSAWIALEFPSKKLSLTHLKAIVESELVSKRGWVSEEFNNTIYYSKYKSITELETRNSDHVVNIYKYLSGHLNVLLRLKTKYPYFLKR